MPDHPACAECERERFAQQLRRNEHSGASAGQYRLVDCQADRRSTIRAVRRRRKQAHRDFQLQRHRCRFPGRKPQLHAPTWLPHRTEPVRHLDVRRRHLDHYREHRAGTFCIDRSEIRSGTEGNFNLAYSYTNPGMACAQNTTTSLTGQVSINRIADQPSWVHGRTRQSCKTLHGWSRIDFVRLL